MEEKQLDFNQPLLSVRRFSSTGSTTEADNKRKTDNTRPKVPPLPVYKSELKSGPVRNPGTVPFVWEKTPGRPKYESKPQTVTLAQPPVVPKLPPGRILNVERQALDKSSEGTAAGQLEARNGPSGSYSVPSLDKNVTEEESSREVKEGTYISGSDDDNEAYEDALDTLSRSESFFLNCSISGVSGLDGPDMKPSGTFSTDPHTRDFMMGRFLPAAKAMASETPQHSTKKLPVVQEQPRKIKKIVTVEEHNKFNQCRRLNNIPHYDQADVLEETEHEDDYYDGPDNSSFKVCGLFPRLCLQNSFCLLNPVPGMRKQAQLHISSSHMKKVKSSYAAYCNETHDKDTVRKQRSLGATGMHDDKNELKNESNKIACRSDYQKLDGSSLYKRLQGNGASPYQGKISQSAVHEEKGYLVIPDKSKHSGMSGINADGNVGENFRELLAKERNEWESTSASPVVEKTLYIDSVYMLKPQVSNSSSSDMKGVIDYGREAVDDSSLQAMKHFEAASEKGNMVAESLESADSCPSSGRSMHDVKMVVMDNSRHDQDLLGTSFTPASPKVDKDGKIKLERLLGQKSGNLESSHGLFQDPIKMTTTEVADDGKVDLESKLCTKLSDQETSTGCYSLLPPPPPLPKSPSESWLKRTLPAVSSKHIRSRSNLGMHAYPRVQASKTDSPDPKWETIVKTSNVQHGHLRFSEELLTPIPEV
ncbi:uncharacterized protein LOC110665041 isoform X2 [Hevea brasiliensis]|uniref:uncharacterized protein LOC110665041 isoform X2 n=1 Tax=Hevea brasiliensis TaxID=3981 RepID=UPI0025DC325E|nr:uncharacterized protein LOC110665041 isoform X2 [Hevea brasiliensis]